METDDKKYDEAADGELSDLLDAALADFGRVQNTDDEIDSLMEGLDEKAAKSAADRFDETLKQYNQTTTTTNSSSSAQQSASSGFTPPSLDEMKMSENFQNMIKVLIEAEQKSLNEDSSATQADAGFDRANAETFIEELKKVSDRDPTNAMDESEFDTLMNLVQTFFAKDVMYPPLKQLLDKFPSYMQEHKDDISAEQRMCYDKQVDVLQKVCAEYEKDESADPEEMKARFNTISSLMMELQSHGYPPPELIGDAPPGWTIDQQSGLPKVDDVSKAADACSLM